MMKIGSIIGILLFSTLACAGEKCECDPQELLSKNCQLQVNGVRIDLRDDKILIFYNSMIKIFPVPFYSSLSIWDSVELQKLKSTLILNFISWDMPGSGGQDLRQAINTVKEGQLESVSQRILQTKSWSPEKSNASFSPRLNTKFQLNDAGQLIVSYY